VAANAAVPGVYAFEEIGPELKLLPLAARRALDVAGAKLSLAAWVALPLAKRRELIDLGAGERVDAAAVRAAIVGAQPPPGEIAPLDERDLEACDARAAELLGANRPLAKHWPELAPLARFALRHVGSRGDAERAARAFDEIAGTGLTHLSPRGEARMVGVGDKPVTARRAVAGARVRMLPATAQKILASGGGAKGDVLAAARIAGIMAAKRTSDLIPLCHPIALSRVTVDIMVDADTGIVWIEAAAEAHDRTGVEMEAMTAASVAALTIYDMLKAVQRDITVEKIALLEKSGGRSGDFRRERGAP
jgi:cyclic pyranopterin monophosphate synthase